MGEEDRAISETTDEDELVLEDQEFTQDEYDTAEHYAEKIIELGEQVTVGRVIRLVLQYC